MFNENKTVAQVKGEGFRRWFYDEYFDLIVWYDGEGGSITGFQLCYDKKGRERALTWRRSGSADHTRVDNGEDPFHSKMTPVLVADGVFESAGIAEKFLAAADALDGGLRDLISSAIMNYRG